MAKSQPENFLIVGILVGLIIFLCLILAWIAVPPILAWLHRKMPVSKKRVNRRYETIDGWLISKVCCPIPIVDKLLVYFDAKGFSILLLPL